ncbi:DUF3874 domain-containing protein [uncultured Bacteroides sp.]|uniref:DUF3874 domain-containing protein n=1 Tax=uncultured Bacteroides sp. TaxID=162156 RepID=UPI00262C6EE9|nr:DUF3874 domain-containing protein [uncultured Bacteroides sp.]
MTLQRHMLLKEAERLVEFSEKLRQVRKEADDPQNEVRKEPEVRNTKAANSVTALSSDIGKFLTSHYDFRYNMLTGESEFRPAGQRTAPFVPVGKRELNTFCIEAHAEGIPCWDKDLNRYIYSTYIPAYHPFHLYMDEFDKYAENQMPLLKNLMQMSVLNVRKAYQQNFSQLPRIASFIGTSNRFDLLTDPTGSRRFLCIEVKHRIDCADIDHDQIFAQLKAELTSGRRSWFTGQEEAELQKYNKAFYHTSLAEEAVHRLFRAPLPTEKSLNLTATDIFEELQEMFPALMRGNTPMRFGLVLMQAGLKRRHTKYGNVYEVVRRQKDVSPEKTGNKVQK